MKKIQKLTALFTALILTLSLCVPVLADDEIAGMWGYAEMPEETVSDEALTDEALTDDAIPEEPAPETEDELLTETTPDAPLNSGGNIESATVTGLKNWYLEETDFIDISGTKIDGVAFSKWKPSVTVTLDGTTLTPDKDYTVVVEGSPNYLPINVKIQGLHSYYGTIERKVWCHYAGTMHGKNRYYTAMYAAAMAYTGTFSDHSEIVIVKGTDYPDALAANAYAGAVKAPILLTKKDALHPACKEFLSGSFSVSGPGAISMDQLKTITVIGGDLDGAIKDIKKLLPSVKVNVIAGKNRYKTAEEVCKAVIAKKNAMGESLDNVFVATGQAPWDALSASTWSYKYQIPVLLAKNGELSASAKELAGQFRRVILLGSAEIVKDSVVPSGSIKVRLAGKNRYKTSEQIGQWFLNNYAAGEKQYMIGAVFAHGEKFPDALAGGQMAIYVTGPVILVNDKNTAPAYVKEIVPSSKYNTNAPFSEFVLIGYVNPGQWKSGYDKIIKVLRQVG